MRFASLIVLMAAAGAAQAPTPEPQTTQALLAEARQLRQDLYGAAMTIQRVQIVMYRLQAEGAELNRVTQRLDEARGRCSQAQMRRKWLATQIQLTEVRRRDSQNAAEQKAAEATVVQLRSNGDALTAEEQQMPSGGDRRRGSSRAGEDERPRMGSLRAGDQGRTRLGRRAYSCRSAWLGSVAAARSAGM